MNLLRQETLKELKEALGCENVIENEVMAPHMSMRVGGPANYYLVPQDEKALRKVLEVLENENIPYYVIGNGTNVIIRDEGYDGAIIRFHNNFSCIDVCENTIKAGAGARLKDIARAALDASLAGLEFASGIPGSLGGAVTMNAGAYGGEMKDVLKAVTAMDKSGNIKTFQADELGLSYRRSIFSSGEYIILEAELELKQGDPGEIKALMDDLNARRAEKQPIDKPSCGSTFKRPEGCFAGKLIMDSGLKGARIGGASVSKKHCGFIINDRNGSAGDVLKLIELVKRTVKEKQGVELECEVKVL